MNSKTLFLKFLKFDLSSQFMSNTPTQ